MWLAVVRCDLQSDEKITPTKAHICCLILLPSGKDLRIDDRSRSIRAHDLEDHLKSRLFFLQADRKIFDSQSTNRAELDGWVEVR